VADGSPHTNRLIAVDEAADPFIAWSPDDALVTRQGSALTCLKRLALQLLTNVRSCRRQRVHQRCSQVQAGHRGPDSCPIEIADASDHGSPTDSRCRAWPWTPMTA